MRELFLIECLDCLECGGKRSTTPLWRSDKLQEALKKLLAGGCPEKGGSTSLGPKGRDAIATSVSVVAIVLINLKARRAGTLYYAMFSIIALCRTYGAHLS
jgi:hypothetical protein